MYVYEQRGKDLYTLVGKIPSGPGGKNALLDKSMGRYFL